MFSHSVKIAFFCLVSVIVATAAENSGDDGGRIVGGQVTTIDRVPYLVQLRSPDECFCGGTLVSARHVVTAAHCIYSRYTSSYFVVGGASTIYEAGVQRTVDNAFVHPLYFSKMEYNFDVAVLLLNAPMSGSIVKTMALPTQRVSAGQQVQISGWGLTSEKGQGASVGVRTVFLPIISQSQCIRQYGWNIISENMFCAAALGKDSCSGDSGGPVIAGNKLVGIVSWGYGCARAESPGVYTDVVAVLPFINQCLKKLFVDQ